MCVREVGDPSIPLFSINEAISRVFSSIVGSKDVDLGIWSSFCVYLRLQSALEEQVDSSHRMRQIEAFEGVHFHIRANSLILRACMSVSVTQRSSPA